MTTRFFPGSHDPDANNLNALLDAMRSGTRAPDAASTSEEATDLAATASQFRTLDDRAKTAAAANDTTFDTIWEDMMIAHTITRPIELAGAPPTRATRIDQRVHPVPPQPQTSWLQSLFSAAIVAIMIAGLISAAWNLRGDTGGGGGSDESARLAATALVDTPEASPEADAFWLNYVVRGSQLCTNTSSPLTSSERRALLSENREWPAREYTPLEPVPDDTLDSIWRNVMQSQSHGFPAHAPLASFSPNGRAFTGRVPNVPPRAEASRLGSWFSIAAMVALLVGLIGGAWGVRQSGGGEDDPIRLAAVVLDESPEAASGEDVFDFKSIIQPNECQQEPMSSDEYIQVIENTEGWPIPTYGPTTEPDRNEANAAAIAARSYTSCVVYGSNVGIYASEPYLWRTKSPNSPISGYNESRAHQEGAGREVSRVISDLTPIDLILEASPHKGDASPVYSGAVLPDTAVQFSDGRIGFPLGVLVPQGIEFEVPNPYYTGMLVMSHDSGEWQIDDVLTICVGGCQTFINGGPSESNQVDLSILSATPIATPEG